MLEPLVIAVALRPLSADFLNADGVGHQQPAVHKFKADLIQLAANSKRREEQQLGRGLRRQLLASYLAVEPKLLDFAQHEFGKPYLKNYTQVEFSQSHCTDQFVLVMNKQAVAIGVDIESKHRAIKLQALAARILTANELKQFEQVIDQQAFLLKIWTIKEAVLKASGLGIRINLNTLESHAVFKGIGQVLHKDIGQWSYQCVETSTHYYTVAWLGSVQQPIEFRLI